MVICSDKSLLVCLITLLCTNNYTGITVVLLLEETSLLHSCDPDEGLMLLFIQCGFGLVVGLV